MLASIDQFFSGCIRYSLEVLDLGFTQLSGYIPDWLGDLQNLKYLDLDSNSLYGSVPASLGRLSSLQTLVIADNELNGTITESLGQLTDLVYLNLLNNSLKDILSEAHFANLTRMKYLDISYNSLALRVSTGWVPPFQLDTIYMNTCQLGPRFPAWLQTQQSVSVLTLGMTGIEDSMPDWFHNFSSNLYYLYLADNKISGKVPQFSSNMQYLFLEKNSFSGPIPPSIGEMMPKLMGLNLQGNNINGNVPLSFCSLKYLQWLQLSKNNLSGDLSDCWNNSPDLVVLDFSHNNISGEIPGSICNFATLQSLHLTRNNLHGEIPFALKSCKGLVTLDLGYNRFSGNIPTWLAGSLSHLKFLNLRSNKFIGDIHQLSHLTSLQFLDLSNNNFSGNIPQSFGNFSAMKYAGEVGYPILNDSRGSGDDMEVFMKGGEFEYERLLSAVILIDLSSNDLSGHIPEELANLQGLVSLNLSGNHLTGEIPRKIGRLQQLECLDLSRNNLSGTIPSSMADLYFLNHLNLSYNNLSGRIPKGNQIQTLTDPFIYIGNPGLCGLPLESKCEDDHGKPIAEGDGGHKDEDDEADEVETLELYMSVALGFVVGFWVLCGVLVKKTEWRIAYFRAVDNMYDWLYVMVVVNTTRLRRKIIGEN